MRVLVGCMHTYITQNNIAIAPIITTALSTTLVVSNNHRHHHHHHRSNNQLGSRNNHSQHPIQIPNHAQLNKENSSFFKKTLRSGQLISNSRWCVEMFWGGRRKRFTSRGPSSKKSFEFGSDSEMSVYCSFAVTAR